VFPPLKSVVAGSLGIIDIVARSVQNRQDFADLERKLAVSIINEHCCESNSASLARLDGLSTAIRCQVAAIQSQREHGLARSAGDVTKVAEHPFVRCLSSLMFSRRTPH